MSGLKATFGVRLRGLKSLRDGRRQSSELQAAAALVNQDVASFIFKRYQLFSRGGGDWPPLAESTKRRKKSRRILYETGDFERGLKQGLDQRLSWNGSWLVLTYTLKARRRHKPSKLTIRELQEIHQRGLGNNLPKRATMVRPDRTTMEKVKRRLVAAIKKRAR